MERVKDEEEEEEEAKRLNSFSYWCSFISRSIIDVLYMSIVTSVNNIFVPRVPDL